MKVKKKWTHLSVRKVTTKFMLLIFTAIVIYVCLNLVSTSSTLSLKVDMFIKMQGVNMKIRDSSRNRTNLLTYNRTKTLPHDLNQDYKQRKKNGSMNVHIPSNSSKEHSDGGKMSLFTKPFDKIPVKDSNNYDSPNHFLLDGLGTKNERTKIDDGTKDVVSDNRLFHIYEENTTKSNDSSDETSENKTSVIDIFGNFEHGTDRKRKLECNECFKHNFNYVIENDICKLVYPDQILDLIVLITTSHKNTKARAALRATWLSFTRKNTENIRYAFLLGEHVEKKYNELILKENDLHHDIIQEEFVDSYLNLTYKTIMGFKWAASKCAHAHFVMKTDDDMFVNLPNVLRIISGPLSEILQSAVAGSCSQKAKPIRHKQSKWYASIESYPQQLYPGFCSGTGYVTSMNVATKVYQISPSVPFFHLEDVYVALCLRKLGFKLQRLPGFNVGRRRMDPCLFKGRFLITAHHMSPIMLQMVWNRKCTRMHV